MRARIAAVSVVPALVFASLCAAPSTAVAGGGQLFAGPALGGFWSSGAEGGQGGLVAVTGGYGISDAFRWYANAEYNLGTDAAMQPSVRHAFSLSSGVAYALDIATVVPWFGLGAQGIVVFTSAWAGIVPALEARVGGDYLISRYFGLTLQGSYALVLLGREFVGDNLTASLGLRWSVDL